MNIPFREINLKSQGGNASDIIGEKYARNRLKNIIDDLKGKRGELLVVGAGNGFLEKELRKHESKLIITSIELNDIYTNDLILISNYVIIDDFITHTFTEKLYDYVVCAGVLEHIEDTDGFLTKLHEVLKNDGTAYIEVPNLASWHGRIELLFGYLPEAMEVSNKHSYFGKFWFFRYYRSIHHIRAFTVGALKELCEFWGFKVIKIYGCCFRFPRFFKYLPSIAGSIYFKVKKK